MKTLEKREMVERNKVWVSVFSPRFSHVYRPLILLSSSSLYMICSKLAMQQPQRPAVVVL